MAVWDVVSKEANSLLASAEINQLQENFQAFADQASGAPTYSPNSFAVTGVASINTLNVSNNLTIDSFLGVGASTPSTLLEVLNTVGGNGVLTISNYTNDANGPYLTGAHSRGTSEDSQVIVQNGDELLNILGRGSDGTNLITAAFIQMEVDGTPGTNDMPGRIVFSTTPDGSASPSERMRINSSGDIGIGNTSPSSKLQVTQSVGSAGVSLEGSGSGQTAYCFGATGNYGFIDYHTNASTGIRFSTIAGTPLNFGHNTNAAFGSSTFTPRFTMQTDGGIVVGNPTGGTQGAGTLNAEALYDDGSIVSDFVFEEDYTLIPIKEMQSFFEKNKHLPWIRGKKDWEELGKPSLGELVNMIYETVENQAIYITQLNERLLKLEEKWG